MRLLVGLLLIRAASAQVYVFPKLAERTPVGQWVELTICNTSEYGAQPHMLVIPATTIRHELSKWFTLLPTTREGTLDTTASLEIRWAATCKPDTELTTLVLAKLTRPLPGVIKLQPPFSPPPVTNAKSPKPKYIGPAPNANQGSAAPQPDTAKPSK